jgi:hypothetical protein
MTNNQFYLHSSPSGIKLIEGDKMPVRQERPGNLCRVTCGQWLCQCHLYADQCQEYESAIQRAKEQAVTVADREKAKKIIERLLYEKRKELTFQDISSLDVMHNVVYGPFSLRYEIRYKTHKGTPIRGNLYLEEGGTPPQDLKEGIPYAILYDDTPEKEPQEDQETLWQEVSRIFNVKWSYGMPDEVMQELKEKFTITRKQ